MFKNPQNALVQAWLQSKANKYTRDFNSLQVELELLHRSSQIGICNVSEL